MNCELFCDAVVSDDPRERAEAERHAASCRSCAQLLGEDRELERQVARWKAAAPAPSPELELRIAAAIEAEDAPRIVPFRRKLDLFRSPLWMTAAAAAVLLVVFGWLGRGYFTSSPDREFEQVLAQAEESRLEYAASIAELERRAQPKLAMASDPDLPPEKAALLLSFRDRLAHLDAVIAEVQGFLDDYPGHSGGNTALLAAYTEKQMVLSQVLELKLGETS